ncbi:diguanylate cyclase [Thiolapillus sp.]
MKDNARYFQEILTRLIFAASGWDKELDQMLAPLQEQLRKTTAFPDLKEISEKLYRFLMQANNNRPARTEQLGKLVSDFLQELKLPREHQDKLGSIVQEASTARTNEEIAAALEACLPILNQALQQQERKPEPVNSRQKGLFSSLFKGAENNAGTNVADEELLTEIREKLLRLLDDLCTPAELEDQVDDLKNILGKDFDIDRIPGVIAGISNLIHDIRGVVNRERKGLEDFLEQLMKRLSLIDGAIADSSESNRAIHQCHQKLEEDIEEQACDIESQARTATDLGQLKLLVQDRVDAIRSHMEEYRSQEQELIQAAEEKTERLIQRLNELETETEQLRQKVSTHSLQALTDTLTGIPNRYAYEERLNQEYSRWKRYHQPLSLMVVDIDNFKHINDKYGHRAGDKALRIIANQLQKMTRETDLIARYGGDEFVLLLPETSAKGAMRIAEKLLEAVESCAFHFREKKVTITISCGVSEFKEGDSPADAFERADQALYKSKHQGRNQSHSG